MHSERHTPTNDQRRTQAAAALEALLSGVLTRGFYGTASIEVAVQDGTIQHVRRRVEQLER